MSLDITNSEIDKKIHKIIKNSTILLITALLIVISSLIADFKYEGNDPYFWFQRSGAIAVLLSAAAEFWLSQIYTDIYPPPSSYMADDQWTKKYGNQFKLVSGIALGFLIIGTIIWGYGDIPFKVS